jgi:hypothetical protein
VASSKERGFFWKTGRPWHREGGPAADASAAAIPFEAAAPRDELEAALAVQTACTHAAAMSVLANFDRLSTKRRIAALGSTAARLMKTFAFQLEVLRRLRNGGQQHVRVEHIHQSGRTGSDWKSEEVRSVAIKFDPPERLRRHSTIPGSNACPASTVLLAHTLS